MTLGEGKRKVLMLLDEYSSGGTISQDADLELRMKDFFDLAQKHVASVKRIVRSFVPEWKPEEETPPEETAAEEQEPEQEPEPPASGMVWCPVPEDFGAVFRIWVDGKMTRKYRWREREIQIPAEELGRVEVEYFAVPAEIPEKAGDEYVFEVAEDAAACMPYFVAAQQLMVDLIVDPTPLMNMYDRMLAALDTGLPESGSGARVRQSFFR